MDHRCAKGWYQTCLMGSNHFPTQWGHPDRRPQKEGQIRFVKLKRVNTWNQKGHIYSEWVRVFFLDSESEQLRDGTLHLRGRAWAILEKINKKLFAPPLNPPPKMIEKMAAKEEKEGRGFEKINTERNCHSRIKWIGEKMKEAKSINAVWL